MIVGCLFSLREMLAICTFKSSKGCADSREESESLSTKTRLKTQMIWTKKSMSALLVLFLVSQPGLEKMRITEGTIPLGAKHPSWDAWYGCQLQRCLLPAHQAALGGLEDVRTFQCPFSLALMWRPKRFFFFKSHYQSMEAFKVSNC